MARPNENPVRRRSASRRPLDPERSRRALIDAALDEFAAHGFAGARVREIARRANVSKDLITYHFGGKEGLYREVQRSWLAQDATIQDPDAPLADVVTAYLEQTLNDPRPMRLLLWRSLSPDTDSPPDITADREDLTSMRRRQQRGEIASDLDPAAARLVLLAAVAAPILLAHSARKLFGDDPTGPDFQDRYSQALRAIIQHLATENSR